MQNMISSDEEFLAWRFFKEAKSSIPLRLASLYACQRSRSERVLTVEDDETASSENLRARVVEKLRTAGYRRSLALRFYGSSSSIMRRKSTIKPLLHRGKLPVLNHCMHRALKTKRRRGLERRPKQNWFFYDRQTRDSESWGRCANNLLDFHESIFTIIRCLSPLEVLSSRINRFRKTFELWKLWER